MHERVQVPQPSDLLSTTTAHPRCTGVAQMGRAALLSQQVDPSLVSPRVKPCLSLVIGRQPRDLTPGHHQALPRCS